MHANVNMHSNQTQRKSGRPKTGGKLRQRCLYVSTLPGGPNERREAESCQRHENKCNDHGYTYRCTE